MEYRRLHSILDLCGFLLLQYEVILFYDFCPMPNESLAGYGFIDTHGKMDLS